MDEDFDGSSADGVEGPQHVEGRGGREAEDGLALVEDYECLWRKERRRGGLILLHPPKHHGPRAAFRGEISLRVWSSEGSEMLCALEEKQPQQSGVVDHQDGLR